MRDAYREGAAHMLDKSVEEVTKEERARFKSAFYYVLSTVPRSGESGPMAAVVFDCRCNPANAVNGKCTKCGGKVSG